MVDMREEPSVCWLDDGDPFPAPELAWPAGSPAPGLLAIGGGLSAQRLLNAYGQGIFPWFSPGQPVCWFHTDPRMVLRPSHFVLHHHFKKTLRRLVREERLTIHWDEPFEEIMGLCATIERPGQKGSWIGAEMIEAYGRLHRLGHAFCLTARIDSARVGGLYGVNLGRMVFGESMFSLRPNGSKLALAALVAWARHHQLPLIDAQQDTAHLRSLGAETLQRARFMAEMTPLTRQATPARSFSPILWSLLWPDRK